MTTDIPRRAGRTAALVLALLIGTSQSLGAHAQTAAPTDALQHVDPQLRALANRPTVLTDEIIRKAHAAPPPLPAPSQDPPVVQKTIKGLDGQPDVSIYVVNAKPGAARPGILHTHGGGYVLGSAKQYLWLIQPIAKALDVTIVSVEYRLAPETTYKGSVADNYAGLKWMYDHASELGVDRKRLAVMGESAGGGHAALLALEARRRGEIPLAFEVLLYPMLDDRTGSTRQPAPYAGRFVWTAPQNRVGWRAFLGTEPGTDKVPAEAVPARTKTLAGLPPAYIAVGDIDLFVEEDVAYAHRLIEAGVPVELHVFRGGYHGFNMLVPDAAVSKLYEADLYDALRRALDIRK
ncbi:MAG: alpha/beta hydrolase [Proteobacteria bacterium]|nr:alpha/beta hydrolase [Pseudomonadota bacterium]